MDSFFHIGIGVSEMNMLNNQYWRSIITDLRAIVSLAVNAGGMDGQSMLIIVNRLTYTKDIDSAYEIALRQIPYMRRVTSSYVNRLRSISDASSQLLSDWRRGDKDCQLLSDINYPPSMSKSLSYCPSPRSIIADERLGDEFYQPLAQWTKYRFDTFLSMERIDPDQSYRRCAQIFDDNYLPLLTTTHTYTEL